MAASSFLHSFFKIKRIFLWSVALSIMFIPFIPGKSQAKENVFVNTLVVDVANKGIRSLFAEKRRVQWDVDDDGFGEACFWPESGYAFLALDKNENGKIDTQSELFGSLTENGFTALAFYDENKDREISTADPIFSKLSLWHPHPPRAQKNPTQLTPLSDAKITSISLKTKRINGQTKDKNSVSVFAHVQTTTDQTGNVFNVRSRVDPTLTTYLGLYTLAPEVLLLPNLRGYGKIPDLFIAMSLNASLKKQVALLASMKIEDFFAPDFDFDKTLQTILFAWSGVDKIAPQSRGRNIDARVLAYIEKLLGRPFKTTRGRTNPSSRSARLLKESYQLAFAEQKRHLAYQLPGIHKLFKKVPLYDYAKDEMAGEVELDVEKLLSLTKTEGFSNRLKKWQRVFSLVESVAKKDIPDLESVFDNAIARSDSRNFLNYRRLKSYNETSKNHPDLPMYVAFAWACLF